MCQTLNMHYFIQVGSIITALFFLGGDAREYPGGLLRLDPAFAYAEPPSS